MPSELDLLRQENAKLMARVAKLEQTAEENDELKARIAKLEQKRLQNVISSDSRPSNSSSISPEDKEVDDFVDLKVKERSPSLQTEVSELEQDDKIDKNQIVEQGLIQELHLPTKENDSSIKTSNSGDKSGNMSSEESMIVSFEKFPTFVSLI
ncbi:11310_t:CDS:2 [Paraglomus occultum]|uniref:11310_t:CDS:1 n=1 Tax=Paraglomus occultum TaxID=144539 RepID=A0A9N8W397_9GLOM|nr:11310_t:CDS:2 [Paraglomus occultum]